MSKTHGCVNTCYHVFNVFFKNRLWQCGVLLFFRRFSRYIYIYIIVFYEMEDRLDMLGSNSVETDDRL